MSEEAIFSEVDEELRRERNRNLWRRFAPYVFGAAVLVVLLVAANEGWNWYQKSTAAAASDKFYAAADLAESGDIVGAQAALADVVATTGGQYPLLASFRQAALLAEDGKIADSVAAYDALANESDDQQVRQLALLLAATRLVDSGDVAGVRARVEGMITPSNSMRVAAREVLGLTQYAAGNKDGARATFAEALGDPAGASDAIGRLQVYMAQLSAEGAADPNPPAEAATPEATPATEPAATEPAAN